MIGEGGEGKQKSSEAGVHDRSRTPTDDKMARLKSCACRGEMECSAVVCYTGICIIDNEIHLALWYAGLRALLSRANSIERRRVSRLPDLLRHDMLRETPSSIR